MASGSSQRTFHLPLRGQSTALSRGSFSGGQSQEIPAFYIGDYENIGLKYLNDPGGLLPSDWPLVLTGPSGTGKTTLALSLAHRLDSSSSKTSSLFTGTDFNRRFALALETNSMDVFIDSVVGSSVLLIDNVHELAGHQPAQLQLASILDKLDQRQTPAILTIREGGLSSAEFDPKLTSRLVGGLCLPVKKPGVAARREIILSFVQQYGLSLPESVTDYLASVLRLSYASIRSFFSRLMVWLQSRKKPVNMIYKDTIMDFLAESFGSANKAAIDRIMKLVSSELGIKIADIKSKSRQKSTVFARSVAGYFLRHYMGMSYATIGQVLGNRDHSTVMHSLNRIESGLLKNNTEIVPVLKKIEGFVVEMILFSSSSKSGKPVEQT